MEVIVIIVGKVYVDNLIEELSDNWCNTQYQVASLQFELEFQ
jgi:hypothetical protein